MSLSGMKFALSFLSLVFRFYQGKTSNLPRIFHSDRTHEILGKYRENSYLCKEAPCLKLTKEIQTTKERKDRVVTLNDNVRVLPHLTQGVMGCHRPFHDKL